MLDPYRYDEVPTVSPRVVDMANRQFPPYRNHSEDMAIFDAQAMCELELAIARRPADCVAWPEIDDPNGVGFVPCGAIGRDSMEASLAARMDARNRKDYRAADEIRDRLLATGISLSDSPRGTYWRRRQLFR